MNVSDNGVRPKGLTIMKKLCGVLPFIMLLSLGGCNSQPPIEEWPVVIEIRDDNAVVIPVSPDLAESDLFIGNTYKPNSIEFKKAMIMANLTIESEKMDKAGYEAGLAGEPGVVPRPLSSAGEIAWRAAWKRGRKDGGHWVP